MPYILKTMKTLYREPLLYFLLLGGIFFVLYQQFADVESFDSGSGQQIRISEGRIQALRVGFEKTWQRPPTAQELQRLVDEFVREEVYYREALALGLDRDDPVLRRRLRQKLEFMLQDLAVPAQADDEVLQAYLDVNPDSYRQPPVFSFRQVFLSPDRRGETIDADARALLEALRSGAAAHAEAGDSTLLQHRFDNQTSAQLERVLGPQFVRQLVELPVGSWQGPIVSSYGLHLVRIDDKVEARLPTLEQVRAQVLRDWSARQRRQANEAVYEKLRDRYEVTIEGRPGASIERSAEPGNEA